MTTYIEYLKKRLSEEGPAMAPMGVPMGGEAPSMPVDGSTPMGMPSHAPMHGGRHPMHIGRMPAPMPHRMHPPMPFGVPLSTMTPVMPDVWMTPILPMYMQKYPEDVLASRINAGLTFADLALALDLCLSPYDVIGVDDPVVLKRVLMLLAKVLGCKYSELHGYSGAKTALKYPKTRLAALCRRLGVSAVPRGDLF